MLRLMGRRATGPRRTSLRSYLRATRVLALVAVLALAAALVSDATEGRFWERHPLLSGLASSLLVVMLSLAIVNEVLARRSQRRWSVLAQHVMFELVRTARTTWTGVLELAGAMPSHGPTQDWLAAGVAEVRDTPRLADSVRRLVFDQQKRRTLHEGIAALVEHNDDVIGRWAAVMLNVDMYAEIIDRHVELASEVMWLAAVLDADEPPDDPHRRRRARTSVAAQLETAADDDWLTDRLVSITQLAEELDRTTLEVALRIVPVEWWESRLGTTVTPQVRGAMSNL
jgi:hypothetical protein